MGFVMLISITEPTALKFIRSPIKELRETQAYYLGYGRNAWHNTWINKYYPESVSFDSGKLKKRAEGKRKQGSVFKVQAVPLLVIRLKSHSYGLACINEKERHYYSDLLVRMHEIEPRDFWTVLPESDQNWILTFRIYGHQHEDEPFSPSLLRSYSKGANYLLGWSASKSAEIEGFSEFTRFAKSLAVHLTPLLGVPDTTNSVAAEDRWEVPSGLNFVG